MCSLSMFNRSQSRDYHLSYPWGITAGGHNQQSPSFCAYARYLWYTSLLKLSDHTSVQQSCGLSSQALDGNSSCSRNFRCKLTVNPRYLTIYYDSIIASPIITESRVFIHFSTKITASIFSNTRLKSRKVIHSRTRRNNTPTPPIRQNAPGAPTSSE